MFYGILTRSFGPDIQSWDKETIRLLDQHIRAGYKVNSIIGLTTPLGIACRVGRSFEIIEYLIAQGAKVNVDHNPELISPLSEACKTGNLELIEYLIARGANVNSQIHEQSWPLFHAMNCRNSYKLVECLIRHGVNVNGVLNHQTVLHFPNLAIQRDTVKLLIKNGASVDARDLEARTPLSITLQGGYLELFETYVEFGKTGLNEYYPRIGFLLDIVEKRYDVWTRKEKHPLIRFLIRHGVVSAESVMMKQIVRTARNYAFLCDKVNTLDVVQFIHGF